MRAGAHLNRQRKIGCDLAPGSDRLARNDSVLGRMRPKRRPHDLPDRHPGFCKGRARIVNRHPDHVRYVENGSAALTDGNVDCIVLEDVRQRLRILVNHMIRRNNVALHIGNFAEFDVRPAQIKINLAHRLVSQVRHQVREHTIANNKTHQSSRANARSSFRLLIHHYAFGIAVAHTVIDDGRTQVHALRSCRCIGRCLPNERRDRHRIGRRCEKVMNLMAEPHDERNETGENDWKHPLAREILVNDLAPITRGVQTKASSAASETSRLLNTWATSSCESTSSRNASASASALPSGATVCFARIPR